MIDASTGPPQTVTYPPCAGGRPPGTIVERWLRFELWEELGGHNALYDHILREAARVEPLFNGPSSGARGGTQRAKHPPRTSYRGGLARQEPAR